MSIYLNICIFIGDDNKYLVFKKTKPEAKIPKMHNIGNVGFDLKAIEDGIIEPGRRKIIGTGLSAEFPLNTYGRILSRSGLAANKCIDVMAGVIDPNYRYTFKYSLIKLNYKFFH